MENPFDFFDEIYCINLDQRKDRWQQVQKEFKKLGIEDRVQRFSAIKSEDGRIGLIKSVGEILKKSSEEGLENVLILEDDVKFINNPIQNLEKALNQLEKSWIKDNWNLFYLGANTHEKLEIIPSDPDSELKPSSLIRLKNAFATHALAYNQSIFQKIIKYTINTNKIITLSQVLDVYLASVIQTNKKSYMVNPIIATQIESFSDIEKRVVNYDFIEYRFKNNIK